MVGWLHTTNYWYPPTLSSLRFNGSVVDSLSRLAATAASPQSRCAASSGGRCFHAASAARLTHKAPSLVSTPVPVPCAQRHAHEEEASAWEPESTVERLTYAVAAAVAPPLHLFVSSSFPWSSAEPSTATAAAHVGTQHASLFEHLDHVHLLELHVLLLGAARYARC